MAEGSEKKLSILNVSVPQDVVEFFEKIAKNIHASDLGLAINERIRLYRVAVFGKILSEAKKIADEHGIKLSPPPPKFLVPFMEKSSLEDEESPLVRSWARLLVSASERYHARHATYVDILSQISFDEANLLMAIWKKERDRGFNPLNSVLSIYAAEPHGWKPISFDKLMEQSAVFIAGNVVAGRHHFGNEDTNHTIESLQILERQNLIKIGVVRGPSVSTGEAVYVISAMLTPLGYDFVSACEGLSESPVADPSKATP